MLTKAMERMLGDFSASYFLKDAIRANAERDLLDSYNDAETLCRLLRERIAQQAPALNRAMKRGH